MFQNIDFEAIRLQGFETGHDAKRAGVYIPNPFLPGAPGYEHYKDGYELGVLSAKIDMAREENIVDFSIFLVDTEVRV